jgi:hypothetical protein
MKNSLIQFRKRGNPNWGKSMQPAPMVPTASSISASPSDGILALTAVGVNPDYVAEVTRPVRPNRAITNPNATTIGLPSNGAALLRAPERQHRRLP